MINIPNLLTVLRLVFAPLIFYLILSSRQYLAFILFIVVVLSDAFDGYIARKYKQSSRIGKLLDPISDKLLYAFVLFGVLLRQDLFFWLWFFGIVFLIHIAGYIIVLKKKVKFPTMFGRICNLAEVMILAVMILYSNNIMLLLFSFFILVSALSYSYRLIKK